MNHEKQIKLIKKAINEGKKVYMTPNKAYEVIKDNVGQYLIKCHVNDNYIGLHGREFTEYEHKINYLCKDNGDPYPANVVSKNELLEVIEL